MDIVEVVVLGLVQGLTEFLPVSSSGHLVAVRLLFNVPDVDGNAFDAFLHLGTLLAVLVFYWRVWWGIARGIVTNDNEGQDKRELAAKLAIATVPAAIAGYFWQEQVASVFRSGVSVAFGMVLTAVAFAAVSLLAKSPSQNNLPISRPLRTNLRLFLNHEILTVARLRLIFHSIRKAVSWHILNEIWPSYFAKAPKRVITIKRASFLDAILIGIMQVCALLPGVSRSGITIVGGMARGLSRKQAATFSFLLSAPIIAGAGLASLGSIVTGGGFSVSHLLVGFVVSFLAGLAAISLLLKIVERISFWPFVVYLLALAGVLFYFG